MHDAPQVVTVSRLTAARHLAAASLVLALAGAARGDGFSRPPFAQAASAGSVVLRFAGPSGRAATVSWAPAGVAAMQQIAVAATDDGDHAVPIAGLLPGTRYAYRVDAGEGAIAAGEFQTAAPPGHPFTFVVYGDNRSDEEAHARVAAAIAREGADFLVNTGDIVGLPTAGEYDDFFRVEGPLLAKHVMFPALGNHEYYSGLGVDRWERAFSTPSASSGSRRYYSFDWGDARFIVLDFNEPTPAQTRWLDATLASARDRAHRFVFLHHGPFSSGHHGENRFAQAVWLPLFQKHNVDLVFSGHDHDYERGLDARSGLRYIVTGGGGAPLYDTNSRRPYQQVFEAGLHHVRVEVAGRSVNVTARRPDGTVLDAFRFTTDPPVAFAPSPVTASAADRAPPSPTSPPLAQSMVDEAAAYEQATPSLFRTARLGLLVVAAGLVATFAVRRRRRCARTPA